MAVDPYLGQIQAFGFSFNPVGWLPCDGRTLPISQYDALYALIGTTYGGDGVQTFAIPDLRGRVPVCMGQGPGLSNYVIGQKSGHETLTITQAQMPAHTHVLTATGGNFMVSDQPGASATPSSTNNVIGAATESSGTYVNSAYNNLMPDTILNTGGGSSATVTISGGSIPMENLEPYLAINFCIAVEGIFPSRN